jgi:NAD(P)-binding Rossmann-like domain
MAFDPSRGAPQRIATIGGGISGLAAACKLSPHHQIAPHEAEPRIGGHARTTTARLHGGQPVDTGFIVFIHVTQSCLTALFRDLDVPVKKSNMSFAVSLEGGRFECSLRSRHTLSGPGANLLSPGFHGLIRDLLRFKSEADAIPGPAIGGFRTGSISGEGSATPISPGSAEPSGLLRRAASLSFRSARRFGSCPTMRCPGSTGRINGERGGRERQFRGPPARRARA